LKLTLSREVVARLEGERKRQGRKKMEEPIDSVAFRPGKEENGGRRGESCFQ